MTSILKTVALAALVTSLTALAAPDTQLFDGRVGDGQITLPGPSLADLPTLEAEVKKQAGRPYPQELTNQARIQQGSPEFTVRLGPTGSFTRPGARQTAFLYRLGYTSGLIILENGTVAAHYNGMAGDYAHYIYAHGLDLNSDGLTDLVLNRNTEDSEEIEACCFLMTGQGPLYFGSTPVFSSDLIAGDGKKSAGQSFAYVVQAIPGAKPRFTRDSYRRSGKGPWKKQSANQPLSLKNPFESGFEPKLIQLTPAGPVDQSKVMAALGKLASYAEVGSSIHYARPANPAEALVAADPELRLMELLDTRAALYAYENATKQQGDHKNPKKYALSLDGLLTAKQIRQAYKKHTDESLGGMSPYQ